MEISKCLISENSYVWHIYFSLVCLSKILPPQHHLLNSSSVLYRGSLWSQFQSNQRDAVNIFFNGIFFCTTSLWNCEWVSQWIYWLLDCWTHATDGIHFVTYIEAPTKNGETRKTKNEEILTWVNIHSFRVATGCRGYNADICDRLDKITTWSFTISTLLNQRFLGPDIFTIFTLTW